MEASSILFMIGSAITLFWAIGLLGALMTLRDPKDVNHGWFMILSVWCPICLAVIVLISYAEGWIKIIS
jgi:hypothetical protein